ncbi:MAG: hypothetical protein M0Z94_17860 [Dehalococcoidales bacterium]|nr:hypothetical protein [Dehalococcoidales bacterium]
MVQKALAMAQPGDVIVIDGFGVVSRSVWGGNRSLVAASRGLAGVIIDGATRDIDVTKGTGLPLFARAVCPLGSRSNGPGEINYPIACGGVVVNPGDIVIADAEGIVVVPREDAADVYQSWLKVVEHEQRTLALSAKGENAGEADVDRRLRELGTELQ